MRSEHFRDFDEFVASVRGVESTMMLQNAARHSWRIAATEIFGIHVQWGSLGSGNIVEGRSLGDGYLIYTSLTDACGQLLNAAPLETNAFMILEPGSEFCLSSRSEHDWCSIFIPTPILDLDRGLAAMEAESDKMISRTTHPDRLLADRFHTLIRHALGMAAEFREFESSVASKVVAERLRKLGSLIVRGEQERETQHVGAPKLSRKEIVDRSLRFLEERGNKHVAVSELAAGTGVSERTLRSAFNEYYGASPARYLQIRNAHRVYRALRRTEPDETYVCRVLIEHGELEFGRFAQRYRRLFGELPSETLRRRRCQIPGGLSR